MASNTFTVHDVEYLKQGWHGFGDWCHGWVSTLSQMSTLQLVLWVILFGVFFGTALRGINMLGSEKSAAVHGFRLLLGWLPFWILLTVLTMFILINSGWYLYSQIERPEWLVKVQPIYIHKVLIPVGWGFLGALLSSILAAVGFARWVEPFINQVAIRSTKRQSRDHGFSDARTIMNSLPTNRGEFNPSSYFPKARAASAVFLGIDETGDAVTVPRANWVKSNVQIMGPPGTGKGVAAGVVLAQSVMNFDDAVIVFDPKNDEWAPSVLAWACKQASRPFTLVDLRDGKPPQINPIAGASAAELKELLIAAFSLGRKGEAADFYRQNDRKAARMLADSGAGLSLVSLASDAGDILGEELAKEARGFLDQLDELASISAVQTDEGVSLSTTLDEGGCLYIIGSMRDEAVQMLQKLLFVRLVQLCEHRERGGRHVTAFLDEFKYLLSKPSVDALGTVRDKGMNILLAHQSLGDFAMVGKDLDPHAVRSTVIDTTPLKWIYRTKDAESAKWASTQTGTILADREMRQAVTNLGGAETASSERRLIQEDRALIDMNTIQHLHDGCAVCIGVGLARLAFAKPIKVEKCHFELHQAKLVRPRNPGDELL